MRGRKIDSAWSNHWMLWIRRNGGSNEIVQTKERAGMTTFGGKHKSISRNQLKPAQLTKHWILIRGLSAKS